MSKLASTMSWHRHVSVLAAVLLAAGTASAQQIRGTVRDAASREPVASAVLLLLDSNGVSRARNITDQRGTYRIAAAAWMKRMRVVRIGFRPSEVPLPGLALASDVADLDVSMTRIPTMLEPVNVSSGAKCPAGKNRLVALSLLENARPGLLAAVVAQEKQPAEMIRLTTTEFLKNKDKDDVGLLRVHVDSSDGVSRAFQAVRSAADFVTLGFHDIGKGNLDELYAPDAETLLDDDFRDGYCFLIREPDPSRPTAVGLGFAPAKTKDQRIDVDGTLWIDTLARQLIEIRYKYLGLGSMLDEANPGGSVHFRTLPNGAIIIDDWHLRLPAVEVDSTKRSAYARLIVKAQRSGGVVARAHWPDGFTWNASLGHLLLQMIDTAGHPQFGVRLILDETDYEGVADSSGIVAIDRLVPGPYSALVVDSILAPIGVGLPSIKFTVNDSETVTTQAVVPSPIDYVDGLCRRNGNGAPVETAAWFVARVVDQAGNPLRNAHWFAQVKRAPGKDSDPEVWQHLGGSGGITGSDGIFAYCGEFLQQGDRVRITAEVGPKGPTGGVYVDLTNKLTAFLLRTRPRTP